LPHRRVTRHFVSNEYLHSFTDLYSMEQLLLFLKDWEVFYAKASTIPIFYTLVNFCMSFIASYVSFPIFHQSKSGDLSQTIIAVRELKKKLRYSFTFFVLRYSFVAGLAATILIEIQHSGMNLPLAGLYGFTGPYVLRERLSNKLKEKVTGLISTKVEDTPNEINKDYEAELKSIRKDISRIIKKGEIDHEKDSSN
jgi:hypothetical protein